MDIFQAWQLNSRLREFSLAYPDEEGNGPPLSTDSGYHTLALPSRVPSFEPREGSAAHSLRDRLGTLERCLLDEARELAKQRKGEEALRDTDGAEEKKAAEIFEKLGKLILTQKKARVAREESTQARETKETSQRQRNTDRYGKNAPKGKPKVRDDAAEQAVVHAEVAMWKSALASTEYEKALVEYVKAKRDIEGPEVAEAYLWHVRAAAEAAERIEQMGTHGVFDALEGKHPQTQLLGLSEAIDWRKFPHCDRSRKAALVSSGDIADAVLSDADLDTAASLTSSTQLIGAKLMGVIVQIQDKVATIVDAPELQERYTQTLLALGDTLCLIDGQKDLQSASMTEQVVEVQQIAVDLLIYVSLIPDMATDDKIKGILDSLDRAQAELVTRIRVARVAVTGDLCEGSTTKGPVIRSIYENPKRALDAGQTIAADPAGKEPSKAATSEPIHWSNGAEGTYMLGFDHSLPPEQHDSLPPNKLGTATDDLRNSSSASKRDHSSSSAAGDGCQTSSTLSGDESSGDDDVSDTCYSTMASETSTLPGTPDSAEREALASSVLDSARTGIIDRLMGEVYSLLDQHVEFRSRTGSPATSGSHSCSQVGTAQSDVRSNIGGKRPGDPGKDSGDPEDERGDDGHGKKTKLDPSGSDQLRLRFACPYYQRNPANHQKYRSCAGPGWESVHRIKEHLYRRHAMPVRCNRCQAVFKTDLALSEHQRQRQSCPLVQAESLQGLDKEQEKRLKSRKRSSIAEEEKWKEMFRILFPDDAEETMPSPHYANSQFPVPPHSPDRLADFELYMSRELPRRIRNRLEMALGPLESQTRGELVDIIRDCQSEVFRSYPGGPARASAPNGHSHARLMAPSGKFGPTTTEPSSDLAAFYIPPPMADPALHVPSYEDSEGPGFCPSIQFPNSGEPTLQTLPAEELGNSAFCPSTQASLYNDSGYGSQNTYGQPLAFASRPTYAYDDFVFDFGDFDSGNLQNPPA